MESSLKYPRHTSYSSFAKLNPFRDDHYTQIEDFYDSPAWKSSKHGHHKGHKSPGMSHSQSEGNIDFRSHEIKDHNLRVGKIFERAGGDHCTRSSEDTDASFSFSRGRTITRTPSPVKILEEIKEDQASNSPPSPTKRSRSPFKQMFGENGWLGRSTSMNELPDDKYRKTGIKHWGGKIKQRVENLVCPVKSSAKSILRSENRPKMCRRCRSSYQRPSTSTNRLLSLLPRPSSMSPSVLLCKQSSIPKWNS